MNPLEQALAQQLGAENLGKIQEVKVGLAGAGGLGSNCAFNLVRSGFKKLVLVDFDCVEASNLNRQFYFADQLGMAKVEALKRNLLRINPDLELSVFQQKIDETNIDIFFDDCQAIVEAFDTSETKQMLVEHFWSSEKFLVFASGLAGWGESDLIMTRRLKNNRFMVGDALSEVNQANPPMSPRVNIAAAKEADLILQWVLEGTKSE